MTHKVIIIGQNTFLSGLGKAVSTFLLFSSLIGIGILSGSSAMQWAGFLIAVLIIMLGSTANERGKRTFTIDEARKELDRLERKAGND